MNGRVHLFRLPDLFGAGPAYYDAGEWWVAEKSCGGVVVLGRAAREGAWAGPQPSGSTSTGCPWLFVALRGQRGWTTGCAPDEVIHLVPAVPIEPLHPEGALDLAITATPIREVGDPCAVPGMRVRGAWEVSISNFGERTSDATLTVAIEMPNGDGRTLEINLVRGLEPGESLELARFVDRTFPDGSTVAVDPDGLTDDIDPLDDDLTMPASSELVCEDAIP